MVARGNNFKQIPVNLVGGSTFGRYPKISTERTWNMFMSDNWLVPYAGYQIALLASQLGGNTVGRACFYSVKLDALILVLSNEIYLVKVLYNQQNQQIINYSARLIGTTVSTSGIVYVAENNKPQLLFSDNNTLYLYDPAASPAFVNINAVTPLDFTPGYITFHDGYFIAAASNNEQYSPPAQNTWILSGFNNGAVWTQSSRTVGLLSSKPDNTQAVVRFPSKGNMILVMGKTVTETWFNTGQQLFPYTRTNQYNIDYGCLSPASVAYMDEIVVWLAANEKSGPVIMFTNGGMPQKITTDGMDYEFAQLQYPEDSQGFLFRQDGHLFYQINFYKDNLSYFYDFNTQKFYNSSDENLNYFIAAQVAQYDNQYYFVSKNTGNLYAFDTIFTQYQDTLSNGVIVSNEIPHIRVCANVRLPTQDYFIANDVGFTVETGETDWQQQSTGALRLVTQDKNNLRTQGVSELLVTQDNVYLTDQAGNDVAAQQSDYTDYTNFIAQQTGYVYTTPRVDLSISTDGGASFGNEWSYILPPIGYRKNALRWWNLGIANDLVLQFKYWGFKSRFVCTDGVLNIRM